MDLYIGTSGYNYKEWKGPFYPEKFPDREMLDFYGQRFNSVEINNSFYRVPKPDVVVSWAERVPGNFRFSMKATRRITHLKRLKGVEEETGYFIDIASNLGPALGALLFALGATGVLIRRNAIVMLMCIELMLQGANVTLAAFSRYLDDQAGFVLVVFSLTVAAAEVAIGLAILVALSRVYPVVNVDQLDSLSG